jgi:hypothetical protein
MVIIALHAGCKDAPSHNHPSCGWYLTTAGDRVPNSQGFCCKCSTSSQFGFTKSSNAYRGNLKCNAFGSGQQSAHCFRYGTDLWYGVYEMAPPYITHTIDVFVFKRPRGRAPATNLVNSSVCADRNVKVPAGLGEFYCTGKLQIGPNRRESITIDEDVSALFLGDYALPRQLQDMTSKFLLIPLLSSLKGASHEQIEQGSQVSRRFDLLLQIPSIVLLTLLITSCSLGVHDCGQDHG